jgi:hypothetical protein
MATPLDAPHFDSDVPLRHRPTNALIARWLVATSATLYRLADLRARMTEYRPRRRGRRESDLRKLAGHPDPDVRLLAELASSLADASARLSPSHDDEVEEIPF